MLREEIIKYLEQIYPDITPETIDSIPLERKRQYERDIATISENYEEFSGYFSTSQDVKDSLYKIKLTKYMDKIFPGYKQMNTARQEKCNLRFGIDNLNMTEIDIIYQKLTNPEDPMYNPNLSEKDAVYIASIYAKSYIDSKKMKQLTGNSIHDPEDWFNSIDEKINVEPSEVEQESSMEDNILKYSKKNRFTFTIKNILMGAKKHQINTQDALHIRAHLKKALSPVQTQTDKNKPEEENSL